MICQVCADAADNRTSHDDCRGGTWCDCQHSAVAAPFRHANGQPCHGCQICLADLVEVEE